MEELNETLIQKAINSFITHVGNNDYKQIPNDSSERILQLSELDKLKLIKLKEHLERSFLRSNETSDDNKLVNYNKQALYTRCSDVIPSQTNEIRFDLNNDERIEIDIDKFDKIINSAKNIEIDIEKTLNDIKIDYNQTTNELNINLINNQKKNSRSNHFIYLPPVVDENEKKNMERAGPESDVISRVNSMPIEITQQETFKSCLNTKFSNSK